MRIVIVGAGSLGTVTARALAQRGHEVVIVERGKARIEALQGEIDCGLLHGDGTRPGVLKETNPKEVDILFALTEDDRVNILACLVGRSLGIPRVVPRIGDEDFEHVSIELGLADTVIPSRAIARYLADMAEGHDILELSSAIKGDVHVFVFVAREQDAVPLGELELPAGTRAMHIYRDGKAHIASEGLKLKQGDEVVLVTSREHLDELRERWAPPGR